MAKPKGHFEIDDTTAFIEGSIIPCIKMLTESNSLEQRIKLTESLITLFSLLLSMYKREKDYEKVRQYEREWE